MKHSAGADVRGAIAEIQQAGWSVKRLADDLSVHPSSVYRWRNRSRTPNRANFTALVQLAEMEYAHENCRQGTRGVVLVHLQRAYELLETDADRARDDAKAAEVAEQMEATRHRESEEMAERYAEVRAQVTADRQAHQVDAFAVVDQDPQMAAIERAFA
jgi:transcriptional regulator with XRE-family HTH domain